MNYNILIIDDDPLVLSDTRLMYEEMIEFGDLDDIFTSDAQGTIATAANTKEAEKILAENFTEDPKLVQILHVDQRMPGETGSEFVDRMRYVYASHDIGAILVTGYSADTSVQNSRETGIYRFISKPVTSGIIKPHLADLIDMIMLKAKPHKKSVEGVYVFKVIDNYDDLLAYYRLRFAVWKRLNYIPREYLSEKSGLEIDEYDRYSIPLGGFSLENNQLAIICRIITQKIEPETAALSEQIIRDHGDEISHWAFAKERDYQLPIIRDSNDRVRPFLEKYGGIDKALEYSRIMVAENSRRGQNLSTVMCQFTNMLAYNILRAKVGLATCLVKHVDHNCRVNGFTGTIDEIGTIQAKQVEQIANSIYIDFEKISNTEPYFHESVIDGMWQRYQQEGNACYCRISDCPPENYKYVDNDRCPMR